MLRITIAITALLLASGVMAQGLTAAQRNACKGDFEKFCKGTVPGGGRIIACLAKQSDQLTLVVRS
jgi:cysteine rich repeat protein